MKFDFAITCREPLRLVTGGIGTYTRLLLSLFKKSTYNIVIFTDNKYMNELGNSFENIKIIYTEKTKIPNNIVPEELIYSYKLYRTIYRFLQSNEINIIEMPDYLAEGYFTTMAAAMNIINVKTAIRLHSPLFMLDDDNENLDVRLSKEKIKLSEMHTLLCCNYILYGNDNMKKRVFSYFNKNEQTLLNQKSLKILHPYTLLDNIKTNDEHPNNIVAIGYIGRLEWRKGVDLLVKNFIRYIQRNPTSRLELNLFGKDTDTAYNGSVLKYLKSICHGFESKIIFHGYHPQEELFNLIKKCNALIFPSRFENYPNALMETYHLCVPTFVSKYGGMSEISECFKNIYPFDPLNDNDFYRIFESIDRGVSKISEDYTLKIEELNNSIINSYTKLFLSPSSATLMKELLPECTIIIPHYNDSSNLIKNITRYKRYLQRSFPKILIVDDGSEQDEINKLYNFINSFNNISMLKNQKSGPLSARLLGAEAARTPYILFMDSDDYVNLHALNCILNFLDANKYAYLVTGLMQCYGKEKHSWMPSVANLFTLLYENCSHSGLVLKRDKLAEILPNIPSFSVHHNEDYIFNLYLMRDLAYFFVYPHTFYFYNRTSNSTRSKTNLALYADSHKIFIVHFINIFSMLEDYKLKEAIVKRLMTSDCLLPNLPITSSKRHLIQAIKSRIPIKFKKYIKRFILWVLTR